MNNAEFDNASFVRSDYITTEDAIRRLIKSGIIGPESASEKYQSKIWNTLLSKFQSGKISTAILKSDDQIIPINKSFWAKPNSHYIDLENNAINIKDDDGVIVLLENDFVQLIERTVVPLPITKMPPGLIFVSSSDAEGSQIAVTYILIEDALDIFSEQRRAYIEESDKDNWRLSKQNLLDCLRNGEVRSFHRNHKGFVRMLNPEDWSIGGPILARISTRKHEPLIPYDKPSSQWISYIDVETGEGPSSGTIIVLSDEVINILKHKPSPNGELPTDATEFDDETNDAISRVGRPKKYDAEAYLLEAFKIIYLGAPPAKSLNELCARALTAYRAVMKAKGIMVDDPPSGSWMKDRLRPLYTWAKDRNSETNF